MKLKDQVCSFKLAKKLKKLRVKQDSLFYWVDETKLKRGWTILRKGNLAPSNVKQISAFTVAELGEMLPEGIKATMSHLIPKYKHENGEEISFYLYMKKQMRYKGWTYYYVEEFNHEGNGVQINNSSGNYDKNEANARAKMFVYLLENKLLRRGNDTTRF